MDFGHSTARLRRELSRTVVCWLLLQVANEGSSPFRNPFIFYTACKRTFFIPKFVRLLQDTLGTSQVEQYWIISAGAGVFITKNTLKGPAGHAPLLQDDLFSCRITRKSARQTKSITGRRKSEQCGWKGGF